MISLFIPTNYFLYPDYTPSPSERVGVRFINTNYTNCANDRNAGDTDETD